MADRDRLGDRRQPDGRRAAAHQARLGDRADAGLRRADPASRRLASADADEEGAICVKLPLPPGTLPTLWGDDDRYVASYLSAFPGYYLTGDGGYVDDDGYLFVMGRTDDVINVAGHRMSTGSIEAVLAAHPAVAECAVIGVADEIKGQVPRGFVVLKAGASAEGLADELDRGRARQHRRGGLFQDRRRRARAAEDPVGQDPAQDHARHRRRPRRAGAVDDRGPGGARRAEADPSAVVLHRDDPNDDVASLATGVDVAVGLDDLVEIEATIDHNAQLARLDERTQIGKRRALVH